MIILLILISLLIVLGIFGYRNEKAELQKQKKLYKDSFGAPASFVIGESNHNRISGYMRHKQKLEGLDDITWNDLGMNDLFGRMCYAETEAGQGYLYDLLHHPATDKESLLVEEDQIRFLEKDPDLTSELRLIFLGMKTKQSASLFDYLDHFEDAPELSLSHIIIRDIALLVCLLVMIVSVPIGLALFLLTLIINLMIYFKQKRLIQGYLGSFSQILRFIRFGKILCEKNKSPEMSADLQALQEKINALSAFSRHSFWLMNQNAYSTSANPFDLILEYVRMLFSPDLIKYCGMKKEIEAHIDDLIKLYAILGKIEATISIACFRASLPHGYCIPELTVSGHPIYEGKLVYHPLLKDPVANSYFKGNKQVLLTGSNASGKSTFLRSIAISAVMAQTIHTVCAEEYHACYYRIITAMSANDDLQKGDSYYMAEIKSVHRILEQAPLHETPVLCVLDELLRGTNTAERVAAGCEILMNMGTQNMMVLAATHDLEQTELLSSGYDNYHFEETILEHDIHFSYQLCPGPAQTRNAILLLEQVGYPRHITERASKRAASYLKNGNWKETML